LYKNAISFKDILIRYVFLIEFNVQIKGEINQTQIKILKIPMVDYFHLIHPSKYHVSIKKKTNHHPFTRNEMWSLYIEYLKIEFSSRDAFLK
jgi:hypothetical protein